MIVMDIIQELFALLLALAMLRWLQTKIPSESTTGKAFAWILH
jgi:hypothetical protein